MNASARTRSALGLPSEHDGRADTHAKERDYDSDVPVASEDEGTVQETRGALGEGERTAGQAYRDELSTMVNEDVERSPLEDGEVQEGATPPSNQQQFRSRNTSWAMRERDTYANEQNTPSIHLSTNSQRKRHWGGSQGSEEQARSIRRPRHGEPSFEQPSLRLPPIAELLANPWGGPIVFGGENQCNSRPLACSTPQNPSSCDALENRTAHPRYDTDSQANVSGKPPTPFSKANTTFEPARTPHGPERAHGHDKVLRTAEWAAQTDDEENALLRSPMATRMGRSGGATNGLREVFAEPPPRALATGRRDGETKWHGGYTPQHWDHSIPGSDGRHRVPAVEDWGTHDTPSTNNMTFAPIPHTKAWQYQHEQRCNQAKRTRSTNGDDAASYCQAARRTRPISVRDGSISEHDTTSAASRRASVRALPRMVEGDADVEQRTHNVDATWHDEELEDAPMHDMEDWRDYEMLPTAVAMAPQHEGVPTLAENPRDRRWVVHFDDPERLVSGQSAGWQQTLWSDPTAVIFTAYNYRLTSNGVVNRHIEGAAAASPHPDPTRSLSARELPFTWGIWGLTSRGAAMMTAIRVASLNGGSEMLEWITRMARSCRSLRMISSEDRTAYILSTLEVRIADLDKGDFVANVFMEPPTDDMAEFRTWVTALRRCEFNNFLNGTGVTRAIYYCGGCRGVNHDTMKCPFPDMEGWQGTRQGALSHTAEILDTRRDAPPGSRGGASRGGSMRGGRPYGGREWETGGSQHGRDGRDNPGHGEGWRTRTPVGRSQRSGGHQQPQQRRRYQVFDQDERRGR
ncbi:hypothetical protein C8T65DRAFT_702673 [Cerioporus squamosus]|nr:hypothetical protein C8T65DRAFT_702673 [Cerioporus squamosus]